MAEDQEHTPDETQAAPPGAPEAPQGGQAAAEAPKVPVEVKPPKPPKADTPPDEPGPDIHVAPSPHLTDQEFTTRRMMTDVLIALSPLLIAAVLVFRWHAITQVGMCLVSCLAAEALFTWMRGKPLTLHDNSAAVTALILAFSLPGTAPWYVSVLGSFVAIGLGKIVFGGLGMNIFNPAMVGRAFVMMAFVGSMAGGGYVLPTDDEDDSRIITRATPMTVMKKEKDAPTPTPEKVRAKAIDAEAVVLLDDFGMKRAELDERLAGTFAARPRSFDDMRVEQLKQKAVADLQANIESAVATAKDARETHKEALKLGKLFLGNTNGSLGEVSALACLIGGVFLCVRKTAAWQVPAGAVAAVVVIAGLGDLLVGSDMTVLHHLFGGAFLFGALFIATDPVSSPLTPKGRWIFGAIFGALVMLLRNMSAYPEGVMFAILLVNAFTPLINRRTIPTPVGGPVPEKEY